MARRWLLMLWLCACGPRSVEAAIVAPKVEASPPAGALVPSPRQRACAPLVASLERAERVMSATAWHAETVAPAMLAVSDDLGERNVKSPALGSWRDAFRVLGYQVALAARLIAVEPAAGRRTFENVRWERAAASWRERLDGELSTLGAALRAHCASGEALSVKSEVDPPPAGLIITETDEAYRLHRVASTLLESLDTLPSAGADAALLDRVVARIARVHVSRHEVAATRAAIVALVRDLRRLSGDRIGFRGAFTLLRQVVDDLAVQWSLPLPPYLVLAEQRRCASDCDRSCERLAIHFFVQGDLERAKDHAQRACGPAALQACAMASATAFESGDDALARRALAEHEALCAEGLGGACAVVARQLDEGRLVAPDPTRARAIWLRLCGEIGGEASCAVLASGDRDETTREAFTRACDDFGTMSACAALGRAPW